MTSQLSIRDIERLLRTAAPDEPSVLPALRLPTGATVVRGARIRVRSRGVSSLRQSWVAALLLLALAAALIAAGALRLLDQPRDPLLADSGCSGPFADMPNQWIERDCLPVEVPEGWTVLADGQLFPGDFTDEGIAYEHVALVMASVPLGDCPTDGPPSVPLPVESDGDTALPRATPNARLWCLREAVLPDNAIRVEVSQGQRSSGIAAGGFAVIDTSEPTPEAGWTELVAGRPARLTITARGDQERPSETRTWDVLRPGAISQVLRIRVDISGPELEAGRSSVATLIDSIAFRTSLPELDETESRDVLRSTLDFLDGGMRAMRSDLYACFPREPGSAAATIRGGFAGPLGDPLAVTCTSAISPSAAGVWRIALDVSWPSTDAYAADTLRTEYFAAPQGGGPFPFTEGGTVTSLSGRAIPEASVDQLFPTIGHDLPPLLDGALALPAGSVARILWPGEEPGARAEPGPVDNSTFYPGIVGRHVYLLDGPEFVDGDEWYLVQWEAGIAWMRGTREGRPLLKAIDPICPPEEPDVDDILWLIEAERLLCFGDRELTLTPAVLAMRESSPMLTDLCSDGGPTAPCPTGVGEPDWLTVPTPWHLFGPGGPSGPGLGLPVWLHPSLVAPGDGGAVRVVGHFDDATARGCELPAIGSSGLFPEGRDVMELVCRQRFVVTSIEPA